MMAEMGIVPCLLDFDDEEWAASKPPDVTPASPTALPGDDTAKQA
jgi:hypothetical protein